MHYFSLDTNILFLFLVINTIWINKLQDLCIVFDGRKGKSSVRQPIDWLAFSDGHGPSGSGVNYIGYIQPLYLIPMIVDIN